MKKKFKFIHFGPNNAKSIRSLDEELHMLSHFIAGEIQGSIKMCEDELQRLKEVEDGIIEESDTGYGNECEAIITKNGVHIDLAFDAENVVTCPLAVFRKALEEWLDFLKTGVERIVEFDL